MNNVFEMLMLICFGVAWPFSLYKSWTTRTTGGKSVAFLMVILLGYIAGITNKVINGLDYVLFFYIANALMVLADSILFFRNKKYDGRLGDSLSGGTPMDNQMKKHHF